MSIVKNLEDFLKKNKVKYEALAHSTIFTAQQEAQAEHVSGKKVAKVVMVRAGDGYVMVVVPASNKVVLNRLKGLLDVKEVRLATEGEFKGLFPECELGAMPPFGNLYDLPVWVDSALSKSREIVFNAGTHRESIKMAYADYEKLIQPRVGEFSEIAG
ncbi:MAG: YbaK/EbsC family protein [Candidatus Omnitrophica bacterium]|nr:YbaK/EbsC family protein [Candidatus Omnitrophota bacterium]